MKDDLKRLLNEFREETRDARMVKIDLQKTSDMPKKHTYKLRPATLEDLILWLNDDLELEPELDYGENYQCV
jgi:hypothetical protein